MAIMSVDLNPENRDLPALSTDGFMEHKMEWGRKKRSTAQHEEDLLVIAHLYVRGYTQEKIAERINDMRPYNITRQQVALDIRKIHELWQEQYLAEYDTAKARELAKIDSLESEYWEGWEASKKDQEVVDSEVTEDEHSGRTGRVNQGYKRKRIRKRTANSIGELKFLEGIQWCIEQRCKIFGLFAPTEIDMNWRRMAAQDGYDPDKVINVIREQILNTAPAALVGSGNAGSLDAGPGDAGGPSS